MRRETFCEILGDLDARYVQEAGSARGAGRSHRLKWGAAAACLCLLLVLPLTAFAVDTLQYNAAVEYLTSLGIPAADLRGYSRGLLDLAAGVSAQIRADTPAARSRRPQGPSTPESTLR